jgi:Holliday junction resolvasome RuvABC endonuclease subunit
MNVMAIDQSSNISGYCVVSLQKEIIDYGIIDLSKLAKSTAYDQAVKRQVLLQKVDEIVTRHRVTQIILEGVYFYNNAKTHEKLSKIQGTLEDYCLAKNLFCFTFENAGEWRKNLNINARDRATCKAKAKEYVLGVFPHLPTDLYDDTYDAISMCCAYFEICKD